MKRDSQATQQRILEAATAEFAQHGNAGARIDRIAEASGSNKSMIYAYFTNKEQLFDAVCEALIARNMHDVPMTADNLPEYAARLFDQFQKYPEVERIGTWDRLERGGAGMNTKTILEVNRHKVEQIAQAQQSGIIGNHFPAATLLQLILALTQLRSSKSELKKHRKAIRDAVAKLIRE